MNLISRFLLLASALIFLSSCSFDNSETSVKVEVKTFNIIVEPYLLDSIYTNSAENIYIPIFLVSEQDTFKAKMRLRGDSSRKYAKKSLKIVFDKDNIPVGESRKINLNSEWTDKTYIRQYTSSKLMQKAGVIGFESNFVKLSLNGKFWGLYLQVENMDKAFLDRNKLDAKGNLYKATKDGACLSHFDDISVKWEKKNNKETSSEDLQVLINQIDTVSIGRYKAYLEKTFEYDKLISIIAMNMLIQHSSTYYHNYYLYHDINGNGKWQMFPWDMDKTLSFYNWKPYKYHETSSNWESDNPLIEKAFLSPQVFVDIQSKIKNLGETIFTPSFVESIVDQCETLLEEAVSNDTTDQIKSISDWERNMEKEVKFVSNQVEHIQTQFEQFPKSFQLERVEEPHSINMTLRWTPSESSKDIKYKLLYGHDFLLEDKETRVIENITDTFCPFKDLKEGLYYWRVYACDGENETEGFNTKNTFEIVSAKTTYITKDTMLSKSGSPHFINNTWKIEEGVTLTIEAGSKLLLAESAGFVNYGNIVAKGNAKDSIWFIPQDKTWDEIYNFSKNGRSEFKYCYLKDGLFKSKNATVIFSNCTYLLENKSLLVNGGRTAMVWLDKGLFLLDSCWFENKIKSIGEGININYAKTVVRHSVFIHMADAVELLNVTDGEISGNIIINSPDDAIDLDGCTDIRIENNIIAYNHDKAISVGTEQYGPTFRTSIKNNLLLDNKYGVSAKDSSFCTISHTSFIANVAALDARLKNNWVQYTIGGNSQVSDCLFFDNKEITRKDEHSIVSISNSISNNLKVEGENNEIVTITFTDRKGRNYNTKTQKGAHIPESLIQKFKQFKK